MNRHSTMRASDEDRERVAERLRQAAVEGRLLAHELEERLAKTFRARTYGDLNEVVSDLPGRGAGMQPRRSRRGAAVLINQPAAVVVAVAAVAVVAVLVAAVVFVAMWGGWLVIIALLTLIARRRIGGQHRYGGRFRI